MLSAICTHYFDNSFVSHYFAEHQAYYLQDVSKIPLITTLTADLASKLKNADDADKEHIYHMSNTVVASFVRARIEKKNVEQTETLFESLRPVVNVIMENLGMYII